LIANWFVRGKKSPLGKNLFLAHEPVRSQICLKLAVPVACYTHVLINKRNLLSAEYEKSFTTALHAVTPRHPIAMTSTAKPPDPMPCALAAVLLPESRAHGCHMQKTLFTGLKRCLCYIFFLVMAFGFFVSLEATGAIL
jgi:hypothetical protein